MGKLKKTILFTLMISMLLTLTGCKNNSATKAVDEFMKDIQKSPFNITMWYKWDDSEYRYVIEDLVSGMEYKIVGETDYTENNRLQEKAVTVEITGYDIGGYYKKYLDNYINEVYKTLEKTYGVYELTVMHAENEEEFNKIFLEAAIEYFKTVMAECKAAGKTYTCTDAKFIAYYNTTEKEWLMSTNGHMAEYIDYVTNNLNSVLTGTQNTGD